MVECGVAREASAGGGCAAWMVLRMSSEGGWDAVGGLPDDAVKPEV